MTIKKAFYIFAVLLAVAVGYDFLTFIRIAYADNSPLSAKYDAVVVLTGGFGRVNKGIELIRNKKADILFISGVNKAVTADYVKSVNGLDSKVNLHLGYLARNTYENAAEVAAFVKENNIRSMVLVTSAYHIPRALYEFKVLNLNVDVALFRVFIEGKEAKKWWKNRKSLRLVVTEYCKYILIRLQRNWLCLIK